METDPLYLLKKYKYYSWIIGIGLLVYANSLFNGFIWDDKTYIITNPQVHTVSWNLLFGKNWFNSAGFYRPIPALYFACMYTMFGTIQFFYHFVQVSIHIIDTALIFIFFRKFFSKNIAFFLSLIFLVHPINTESVGYIASSVSVLFFFFGMSALLLSWREIISRKRAILISFLLLLSIMTKETGVLFVVLILLSRFFFKVKHWKLFSLVSICSVVLYGCMRIMVIGLYYPKVNVLPIMRLSFIERLLQIPAIIFYYLKTMIVPVQLAVSQNWTIGKIGLWNFYLPLAGELGLLGILGVLGMVVLRKNKKDFFIFLFFLVWFTIGIDMLLQIVPLDMTVADRWFYFPMVGLLGVIGVVLSQLRKIRNIWIIGIIIIAALSMMTIIRNTQWVDAQTLYTHDIAVSDDYNKEDGLAVELLNQGYYDEAEVHVRKAIAMNPIFANLNDLGVIYQHTGDYVHAKEYYKKAINASPDTASPFLNLAALLVLHDSNPAPAIPILKNVLIKEYPTISRFWVLLAIGEYRLGHYDNALAAAQKAVSLSSNLQSQYVLEFIQSRESVEKLNIKQLE
jgi:hypothetical protein